MNEMAVNDEVKRRMDSMNFAMHKAAKFIRFCQSVGAQPTKHRLEIIKMVREGTSLDLLETQNAVEVVLALLTA